MKRHNGAKIGVAEVGAAERRYSAHRGPLGTCAQRLPDGDRGLRGAAPESKGLTQSDGRLALGAEAVRHLLWTALSVSWA